MVKRKSSAPQRLCEEKRSELTWDLTENDKPVLNQATSSQCIDLELEIQNDVTKEKQNTKRQRRKSQQGDEVTDKNLKSIIDDCSFYIALKKDPGLGNNERAFLLGKLTLTVQKINEKFPDGEYWLYISEFPNRSLLYIEGVNGVQYFLIEGTLDYQLYSGLSLRGFVLVYDGFIEESQQICLNVLFRESHSRGATAHLELKQKNANQDFKAVISYFFGIVTPVFNGIGEVRKHDITGLYKAVKEHHEDAPSDKLEFTQHASLVPLLRPYQSRAVKWMLCRESITNDDSSDELHCLYTELKTPDGQQLYYNKYAGYVSSEKPTEIPLPTGGILADEMGLGKTVEVLACLLANPRPESDFEVDKKNEVKEEPLINSSDDRPKSPELQQNTRTDPANDADIEVKIIFKNGDTENTAEQLTDANTDIGNGFVKTEETEDSQEVQLVDLESDVAANVMITSCDDSFGADSSFSDVKSTRNFNEISQKSSLNLSSSSSRSPHNDSGYQNSLSSDILYDLENYGFDSDEFLDGFDKDDDDDPNDEDWGNYRYLKFERLKTGRRRKSYRNRSSNERKDIYSEAVAACEANRKRRKRKSNKVHKKYKKKETDSVEDTIEEVITKYCSAKSDTKNRRGKLREISSYRAACQIWYQEMLSAVSLKKPQKLRKIVKGKILECVCGADENDDKPKVCCSKCGRWQHAKCVRFKQREGENDDKSYCCPHCWQVEEPVVSGATLIVSPASISNQWVTEIQRHISEENFSILVYKGVNKEGFLQPHDIAKYHIVITTYETLRKELNYADLNTTDGHRLRHVKRFLAPPSPLPCVQWWRLCLDEAQMVECTGSKTAEMARRLGAVHRWAITGTPVQKSVHDIFGLVQFLGIDPHQDLRWWQDLVYGPYCHGDNKPLYQLMGKIMWRTAKKDVLHQINIPEQTEELEWLHFSPVEEHFYRRQHSECSQDFIDKLSKMHSLDIPLDTLDRQTMNKILGPLLRLRQACSHPQAVRGQFLTATKATMSMEELLESLIKKTKSESEEALRQHIASLNGLAGIHIIRENWAEAVETYRDVLRIAEEYKGKLKTDKLQMIHTLHNLADMLDGKYKGISPTLRDDRLREEAKVLEQKYMHKCDSQVAAAQETLANLSIAVNELENGFSMGRDDWWEQLLAWLVLQGEETELLSRIRDDLLENRVPGQESVINRVSNIRGLEYELGTWSDAVERARNKAVKELRQLEITARQDLVNEAVDCHLRLSNANNKNKKKCRLCICESHLKNYESLVFAVSKKQTEHSMVGDVLMLGQLNQGTWKPCEMECVLRVLVAFVRGKRSNRECLDDGNQHLKLLDAIKKEFKHLRLVWTQLRDQVSAQDELDMAKLRLRIRYPDEPIPQNNKKRNPLQQLSSNIANAVETIHIIEQHQVSSHETKLESDRIVSRGDLRRKTGQLLYLENLRKSRGLDTNPDPCPVCQTNLGDKWSVLQCGHCYCMECIRYMVDQSRGFRKVNVKCPICRDTTPEDGISYVNLSAKVYDSKKDGTSVTVRGSHSTKVEAVVHRLLALRAAEPQVKALVFSTWEKVLDVLADALTENDVAFCRLQPGLKHQEILQQFKDSDSNVTALLLPVRWGAKGLNLVEATHVLLVEPILNPADELQAIGRVHRIGQTRKTVIHRFLVRGTVEERMHSAVRNEAENWSGDKVTLRQLQDLFAPPSEDMTKTSDEPNKSISDDNASPSTSSSDSGISTSQSLETSSSQDTDLTQESSSSLPLDTSFDTNNDF